MKVVHFQRGRTCRYNILQFKLISTNCFTGSLALGVLVLEHCSLTESGSRLINLKELDFTEIGRSEYLIRMKV